MLDLLISPIHRMQRCNHKVVSKLTKVARIVYAVGFDCEYQAKWRMRGHNGARMYDLCRQ
jgi:hypothetical protein